MLVGCEIYHVCLSTCAGQNVDDCNSAAARIALCPSWPWRPLYALLTHAAAKHQATAAILTRRTALALLAPQSTLAGVALLALETARSALSDFAINTVVSVLTGRPFNALSRQTAYSSETTRPDNTFAGQTAFSRTANLTGRTLNAFSRRTLNAFAAFSLNPSEAARADNAFAWKTTFALRTNWANNAIALRPTLSKLSVFSRQTLKALTRQTF